MITGIEHVPSTHLRLQRDEIFENDRNGTQQSNIPVDNEQGRDKVEPGSLPKVLDLPPNSQEVVEIQNGYSIHR